MCYADETLAILASFLSLQLARWGGCFVWFVDEILAMLESFMSLQLAGCGVLRVVCGRNPGHAKKLSVAAAVWLGGCFVWFVDETLATPESFLSLQLAG